MNDKLDAEKRWLKIRVLGGPLDGNVIDVFVPDNGMVMPYEFLYTGKPNNGRENGYEKVLYEPYRIGYPQSKRTRWVLALDRASVEEYCADIDRRSAMAWRIVGRDGKSGDYVFTSPGHGFKHISPEKFWG